jgi:hypothetical protein
MTGEIMGKDDNFLARWSRRKREQERELASKSAPAVEPPASESVQEEEPEAALENSITQEELEKLPRVEDITAGTDIRPFLRHGVPRALRNAALRRKWLTTPSIRDHKDCAVDYAWDWNTPGGVPGDGAISGESVTRLVRSIVGKGTPDDARPEAATRTAAPIHEKVKAEEDETGDASPVTTEPAPPPEPVDNAAAGTKLEETKGEDPRQAHIAAPRRHGSARPA